MLIISVKQDYCPTTNLSKIWIKNPSIRTFKDNLEVDLLRTREACDMGTSGFQIDESRRPYTIYSWKNQWRDLDKSSTAIMPSINAELDGQLKAVEKSVLPGIFKTRLYLSGINLLISVYLWNFYVKMVIKCKVNSCFCKWLDLSPHRFRNIGLHKCSKKLKFSFKSVKVTFTVIRT